MSIQPRIVYTGLKLITPRFETSPGDDFNLFGYTATPKTIKIKN